MEGAPGGFRIGQLVTYKGDFPQLRGRSGEITDISIAAGPTAAAPTHDLALVSGLGWLPIEDLDDAFVAACKKALQL